jgi:hypothetical protein
MAIMPTYRTVANNCKIFVNGSDAPINNYVLEFGFDKGTVSKHLDGCTPDGTCPGINYIQFKPTAALVVNQIDLTAFELMVGNGYFDLTFQFYATGDLTDVVKTVTAYGCKIGNDKLTGSSESAANVNTYLFNCMNIA